MTSVNRPTDARTTGSDEPARDDPPSSADESDPSQVSDLPHESELPQEEVFSILANDRRREAIKVLCDVDDAIELKALAERVTAVQCASDEDPDEDACQNMYISLYQTHVPVLEEAGVVEYDSDRGTVTPTASIDVFERHLEPTSDDVSHDDWIDYYVLGGIVSIALWIVHALSLVKGYGLVLHSTSVLSLSAVVLSELHKRVRTALPRSST